MFSLRASLEVSRKVMDLVKPSFRLTLWISSEKPSSADDESKELNTVDYLRMPLLGIRSRLNSSSMIKSVFFLTNDFLLY